MIKIINEKVIAVFVVSILCIVAVSNYLSHISKEELSKAFATINYINQEEKEKIDNINLSQ